MAGEIEAPEPKKRRKRGDAPARVSFEFTPEIEKLYGEVSEAMREKMGMKPTRSQFADMLVREGIKAMAGTTSE